MSSIEKEKYEYGKIERKRMKIRDLIIPEVRVTAMMPEELQEFFRLSIKSQGVLNPPLVIYDGDKYYVVDGKHRVEEARNQNQEEIDCIVRHGRLDEVLLFNLTTGKLQGRGKVTDMIRVVNELVTKHKMSLEDIALKTGYRLRYLEDLLAIANAHPDILDALDKEEIPLGAAIELTRIPDKDAQLRALWNVRMYRMRISDVKDMVDQIIGILEKRKQQGEQQPQPVPRDLVLIECNICEGKYPAKDMRTLIVCPRCMNMIWEWKIAAQKELEEEQKKKEAQQQKQLGSTQERAVEPEGQAEIELSESQNSAVENGKSS